MKEWVCEDCGHVHKGDVAPDECPVCGALKESCVPDSKQLLNE